MIAWYIFWTISLKSFALCLMHISCGHRDIHYVKNLYQSKNMTGRSIWKPSYCPRWGFLLKRNQHIFSHLILPCIANIHKIFSCEALQIQYFNRGPFQDTKQYSFIQISFLPQMEFLKTSIQVNAHFHTKFCNSWHSSHSVM